MLPVKLGSLRYQYSSNVEKSKVYFIKIMIVTTTLYIYTLIPSVLIFLYADNWDLCLLFVVCFPCI